MGGVTLAQGRLFGAFLETVLYGVNIILVLAILCLFAQQTQPSIARRIGVCSIVGIFVLCTVHLAAVIHSVREAFFDWPSPEAYYEDRGQPTNVVMNAAYGVAVIVADGLMIYRVYVMFGGQWKMVVLPSVCAVVTAVVWFILVHNYRVFTHDSLLETSTINCLAPIAYILSFVTNVIITASIVVRTLLAMRQVRHLRPASESFHRRCLAYAIESGVLYPASLLATGILWFLKNESLEILAGSNLQLLCMVPILLSLQMRLNLSIYDAAKGLGSTSGAMIGTEIGYPTQFHRIHQATVIVPSSLHPQHSAGEAESRSTRGLVHKESVCSNPESLAEVTHDSLSDISEFSKSSGSRVAVMDGK